MSDGDKRGRGSGKLRKQPNKKYRKKTTGGRHHPPLPTPPTGWASPTENSMVSGPLARKGHREEAVLRS
jgi:hypothetical protein